MINERVWDAVAPLLREQRRTGRLMPLDDCVEQARAHGARVDLVVLLVRHELPLARRDRSCLFPHLVVDVATSRGGGIYRDDDEMLEALNLAAQALGTTIQVNLIDRRE